MESRTSPHPRNCGLRAPTKDPMALLSAAVLKLCQYILEGKPENMLILVVSECANIKQRTIQSLAQKTAPLFTYEFIDTQALHGTKPCLSPAVVTRQFQYGVTETILDYCARCNNRPAFDYFFAKIGVRVISDKNVGFIFAPIMALVSHIFEKLRLNDVLRTLWDAIIGASLVVIFTSANSSQKALAPPLLPQRPTPLNQSRQVGD